MMDLQHHSQVFNLDSDEAGRGSERFDDDRHLKRTGTAWTASTHIVTAVIGSGVLSLAWAIAQLGWIIGPITMLLFSCVTYYTSCLLTLSYRTGDPVTGKRNYTYQEAVKSILGGYKYKLCGLIQYLNLFGIAIGYTIAASISMMAIEKSNCFHIKGHDNPCKIEGNIYILSFGIIQIIFSQIPDFDQLWWLSALAAVMSFSYSIIGLGLGLGKIVGNGKIKGSLTGVRVGDTVTQNQKVWRTFQSFGNIAFAYSYSMILIEIQDTVRSPPSESTTMKKASAISIAVTTFFYMLCGCLGYGAFGDAAPGNLLTGFGFYNPYWLVDIANFAIIIHLVGAFQVFCQPLFSFVEEKVPKAFPASKFFSKEFQIPFPGMGQPCNINLFRLIWRTLFVVLTTTISMALPFFNDVVGLLGAIGFWPLTVFFPIEMYIVQTNIPNGSTKWVFLQLLSLGCFLVSIAAATGSIAGIAEDLQTYEPFRATL